MFGWLTTWVETLKYFLNVFNSVAYQSFVSHSKMSEVTDAVTWNSSRSHLRLFLRNFLITELMVSYNENFHSKFEVTMCFIVMSCYYVDNRFPLKMRALTLVACFRGEYSQTIGRWWCVASFPIYIFMTKICDFPYPINYDLIKNSKPCL